MVRENYELIEQLEDNQTLFSERPDLLAEIEAGVREHVDDPTPDVYRQWALSAGAYAVLVTLRDVPERTADFLWFCHAARRIELRADQPVLELVALRTIEAYRIHFNRGEYAQAQSGLLELVEHLPSDHEDLAVAYAALARLEGPMGGSRADEFRMLAEACPNKPDSIVPQVELDRTWSWIGAGLLDHAVGPLERARRHVEDLAPEGDELAWTRAWIAMTEVEFALLSTRYDAAVERASVLLDDDLLTVDRNEYFVARARAALGLALLLRGRSASDLERAAEILREVIAQSGSDAFLRSVAASRLGYLEVQRGNYRAAETLLEDAEARLAEIDVDGEDLVLEVGFHAAVMCHFLIAEHRFEELSRARDDLTSAFDTLIARWHETPSPEGGRGLLQGFLPRTMLSVLCEAERALDPKGGDLAALEHVFHAQTASTLLSALDGAGATLEAFRSRLLSDNVGALIFVPGPSRSFVFAVDGRGCDAVPVPRTQELRAVAQTFQRWVAQPPGGALDATRRRELADSGTRLVGELFPERIAARVESWSHIAFLGQEHLAGLCVEALPWEGSGLLGHEKAVFSMLSMPLGLALDEHPSRETRGLGLLVSPEHGAPPQPLSLSAAEVGKLAIPTFDTAVHVHGAASWEGLTALSQGDHAAWTVITHGLYDATHPIPSGILLSSSATHDGRVFSADVRGLRVAPIVFLGACSTGRGPMRAGDAGASTLAAAFFEAGARAVVDAHHAVPAAETIELAAEFHRELFAGVDPAESMRRARVAVAADGHTDPYFTCLLGVRGLGQVSFESDPLADSRSGPATLLFCTVLVATLMAAIVWLNARR